jgi:hypothetical protein
MTYDTSMGKLVTVRIMSDAICAKPGITPKNLSVVWAGHATDPITPTHADAGSQLGTIISVTGLNVDRPL